MPASTRTCSRSETLGEEDSTGGFLPKPRSRGFPTKNAEPRDSGGLVIRVLVIHGHTDGYGLNVDNLELCFQRDGTWFHLYAARRKDFATDEADPHALITSRGGYASTAWADANMVYALVAHTGAEVLRRVI